MQALVAHLPCVLLCAAVVPAGFYLKTPGVAAACPQGEFKADTGAAGNCSKCAFGVTTTAEGSTSEAECKGAAQ